MIGLMFNLVERYAVEHGGDAAVERALREADFLGADPWLDCLNYPHEHFARWLGAVARVGGHSPETGACALARWALPRMMQRYASLTVGYHDPLSLLADVSGTIYPQLNRMLGFEPTGHMKLHLPGSGRAELDYCSPSRNCLLLEGALLGLGDHFDTPVELTQPLCQRRGDEHCRFVLQFPAAGS